MSKNLVIQLKIDISQVKEVNVGLLQSNRKHITHPVTNIKIICNGITNHKYSKQ